MLGQVTNGTTPLFRYDLTSQAGEKLLIPYSPPSTQTVYSNIVYLLRETFMVSASIASQRGG
jgi:hypothetical protein